MVTSFFFFFCKVLSNFLSAIKLGFIFKFVDIPIHCSILLHSIKWKVNIVLPFLQSGGWFFRNCVLLLINLKIFIEHLQCLAMLDTVFLKHKLLHADCSIFRYFHMHFVMVRVSDGWSLEGFHHSFRIFQHLAFFIQCVYAKWLNPQIVF